MSKKLLIVYGMLYKLLQLGMDRRLWAIIFDSYTDFRCAVNIDGVLSEWFSPSQGVHQGEFMSTYLYCIYNNDLLEELLDVACPLKINNHILTCPAFADDVAIVSKSSASLQHKVDIAKCHSRKWRYNLSIPKIRIVAFNPITKGQPCKITLDNQLLQCVDGHLHVGVPLCASVAAERTFCDERVRQHRTFCCMVQGIGSATQGINPITASKLYWAVALPRLLYGCEVWGISDQHISLFQKAHEWAARAFQGLPAHSPALAATGMLGWLSIEAIIDLRRLSYVYELITFKHDSLVRQLFVHIFLKLPVNENPPDYKSPIARLYATCEKYNLLDSVNYYVIFNSTKITKEKWKYIATRRVSEMYRNRWNISRCIYTSLQIFNKCVSTFNVVWFWQVAKQRPSMLRKCKIVARILVGGAAVYKNKMTIYNKTIQICPLCTSYERLSVEHALLTCNSFDHERSKLWSRCIDVMPPAMALSLNLTSHDHKLKLILSGLNVVFNTEWLCIHEGMINFMADMHVIVCEKLSNLQHYII